MALISLRQLLDHAAEHGYGIPAFNVNNMEQVLAILAAAKKMDAPVIIQASKGARAYANDSVLKHLMMAGRRNVSGFADLRASGSRSIAVCVFFGDDERIHLRDDGWVFNR